MITTVLYIRVVIVLYKCFLSTITLLVFKTELQNRAITLVLSHSDPSHRVSQSQARPAYYTISWHALETLKLLLPHLLSKK